MSIPTASMLSHVQYQHSQNTDSDSNNDNSNTFMSTTGSYSQTMQNPQNSTIFSTPLQANRSFNNNVSPSPFAMNKSISTPNASMRSLNSNSFTPTRSKRRNSNDENEFKKVKPESTQSTPIKPQQSNNMTLDNIDLNEFPKFHHPEGGFIQFTPIGNVRTFIGENNNYHRIIEKNSKFDLNNLQNGIDGYKLNPTTNNNTSSFGHAGHDHDENHNCCGYFNENDYDCDSDEDMY